MQLQLNFCVNSLQPQADSDALQKLWCYLLLINFDVIQEGSQQYCYKIITTQR